GPTNQMHHVIMIIIGRATATPNIIVIMQLEISKNFSHFQPPLGIAVAFHNQLEEVAHVVGWKRRKYRLQSISKDFSQDFHTCIEEGNRDKSHIRSINTFHSEAITGQHFRTKSVELQNIVVTSLLSSINKGWRYMEPFQILMALILWDREVMFLYVYVFFVISFIFFLVFSIIYILIIRLFYF
ncbi:hypothetical protein ACJX0J_000995, partial [Zea mays]